MGLMKRYRVWEANQVFLAGTGSTRLRDDKSQFFKDLERASARRHH
jgi:hypothetical protein